MRNFFIPVAFHLEGCQLVTIFTGTSDLGWATPINRSTLVKTDFYNDIKAYLSTLTSNPNNIQSLEDIVTFNNRHTETEGGIPCTHPAWITGQDSFDKSLATRGVKDETYYRAVNFIRRKSGEERIDAALCHEGFDLDGLLVPVNADGGAACQVAAKAAPQRLPIVIRGVRQN